MAYKCPTCGKDIDYGVKFCPHCGAGIGWNTNENDDEEDSPKWLKTIFSIILWGVIGGAGLWAYNYFFADNSNTTVNDIVAGNYGNSEAHFLDIHEKAVYDVTFSDMFASQFAPKAKITLYKDGSGTCEFIPDDNMPPFKQCSWNDDYDIPNPMSKGGDGNPIKAIMIKWHTEVYVIDARQKIYWVIDRQGELACIGSVKRVN